MILLLYRRLNTPPFLGQPGSLGGHSSVILLLLYRRLNTPCTDPARFWIFEEGGHASMILLLFRSLQRRLNACTYAGSFWVVRREDAPR